MNNSLRWSAFSATHIGLKRSENQDAFGDASTRYGHVFVVCDGMGGHAGGVEASQLAVKTILDYLSNEIQDSVVQALHEAIVKANSNIYQTAQHNPELRGMGSTCVVVLLSPEGQAYLAHVGDSRVYGWQKGQLYHLTKDHSFVQLLVDQGEVSPEDAENHPNKNKILRALGAEEEVKPTISSKPLPLSAGMRFLLCSDGLNGMVSEADICKTVTGSQLDQQMADMLISQALNGGGKDNITLTLIDILDGPFHSEFSEYDVRGVRKKDSPVGKGLKPISSRMKYMLMLSLAFLLLVIAYFLIPSSNPDAESPGPEPAKTESQKPSSSKPSSPKGEASQSDTLHESNDKVKSRRSESSEVGATKQEVPKSGSSKPESTRSESREAESPKVDSLKSKDSN
jgi:serine/threonine protein phosphatase PrpC